MKINHIIYIAVSLVLLTAIARLHGEEDLNRCVVKYKSEWGKPCTNCLDYSKSYRAYFRN
jgi:hypothetical protein